MKTMGMAYRSYYIFDKANTVKIIHRQPLRKYIKALSIRKIWPFQGITFVVFHSAAHSRCQFWCCLRLLIVQIILSLVRATK